MLRWWVSIFFLFSFNFHVLAQEGKNSSYETLLNRAKQADPRLDFKALRLAYCESSMYNPHQPPRELHAAILNALRQQKYAQCLSNVDCVLQQNYVDINVHFAAYRAYSELKMLDKAKFHHYLFDGLIRSILTSGDGKSVATAYVVISSEEIYAVLDATGLRRVSQESVKENGRNCDLIVARDDKANKEYRVFFNIDRQLDWLSKNVKKDSK
jgi:Domain of unknown function (DUF4919)